MRVYKGLVLVKDMMLGSSCKVCWPIIKEVGIRKRVGKMWEELKSLEVKEVRYVCVGQKDLPNIKTGL